MPAPRSFLLRALPLLAAGLLPAVAGAALSIGPPPPDLAATLRTSGPATAGATLALPPSRPANSGADGAWVHEAPPEWRHSHAAAAEAGGARIVLVGGHDGTLSMADVWILRRDPAPCWERAVIEGERPHARLGHSLVFDAQGGRFLMFGGAWELDATTWAYSDEVWALTLDPVPAWTRLEPAGEVPGPRMGHVAAYDDAGGRMLVFAGRDGSGALDDLWSLDPAGEVWTPLAPAGATPAARDRAAGAFDPARRVLAVAGGLAADDTTHLDELWLYDVQAGAWDEPSPAGPRPSARHAQAAAYDGAGARLLFHGGARGTMGSAALYDEVWALTLDPPAWERVEPTGTAPAPRAWHSATVDPGSGRLLLFGGSSGAGCGSNEVCALSLGDDPAWLPPLVAGSPLAARRGHAAVIDPLRGRMLVIGGLAQGAGGGSEWLSDVWSLPLEGAGPWTPLAVSGTPPAPRAYHTAIYDAPRDRVIVYAGQGAGGAFLSDTWALDLSGPEPSWSELSPLGTRPAFREMHTAVFDPVGERMVVYAGHCYVYRTDVWTLSLAGTPTWIQIAPGGGWPVGRARASAVYDPAAHRMLVYGGYSQSGSTETAYDELWSLSLGVSPRWTQLTPGGEPPPAGYWHSAVWDPARGRMLVFGGRGLGGTPAERTDTWSLALGDAPAWTRLQPLGDPEPRAQHSAVFDAARDRMVVFGGSGGGGTDLWTLGFSGVLDAPGPATPVTLALAAVRPNPARDGAGFEFDLPRPACARITVRDAAGRVIAVAAEGMFGAGRQAARWDGRAAERLAPPGVYFATLEVPGQRATRRFAVVR
jgi:hypothetical protein